jgi:hypothetical protein
MNISRRRFLHNSAAAAASVAFFGTLNGANGQSRSEKDAIGDTLAASRDPLGFLTQENFVPFTGETFVVKTSAGRTVQLRLIEVNGLVLDANVKRGYVGESYSLIFDAPRSKSRPTGDLYQFDHYALGQFSLLVLPVGLSGTRYEAIVNRITR